MSPPSIHRLLLSSVSNTRRSTSSTLPAPLLTEAAEHGQKTAKSTPAAEHNSLRAEMSEVSTRASPLAVGGQLLKQVVQATSAASGVSVRATVSGVRIFRTSPCASLHLHGLKRVISLRQACAAKWTQRHNRKKSPATKVRLKNRNKMFWRGALESCLAHFPSLTEALLQ